MQYRNLGKSNLKVSALCLGAMMFGDQTERAAAADIVASAHDHGVNFIDTADVYTNGASEEMLGDLLKGHNVRHIFFGHAHRTISGQWRGISYSALPGLAHQLPLVNGSVSTVYSDEPAMYSVVHLNGTQITVHSDAFMHRTKVQMADDEERGNWS